jgi:hypothetical protein
MGQSYTNGGWRFNPKIQKNLAAPSAFAQDTRKPLNDLLAEKRSKEEKEVKHKWIEST